MASIASKLARAAVACRFSPAAVGDCTRTVSPCLPRWLYLTGRPMCSVLRPAAALGARGRVLSAPLGDREVVLPPVQKTLERYQMEPIPPMPQELVVTKETLESDEALRAMYEFWRKYYGISRDPAEMDYRFKIFKKTAKFVHKTNNSGYSYKVGMNLFADQTLQEVTSPRRY